MAGFGALIAAPALVRANSLMPISSTHLWTPPKSIVGAIKPIVGPIPEGWVECDGRWLHQAAFPALAEILRGKNVPEGFTPYVGQVFLPDMTLQAQFDRLNGKEVGRYVMYAGDDRIRHKAWLDAKMEDMKEYSNQNLNPEPPDYFTTVQFDKRETAT